MSELPFDTPEYHRLSRVRQAALGRFLDELAACRPLRTALDVGCGAGAFTRFLRDRGLEVLGVDVREANVEEARRRHPDLRFAVGDVEALGPEIGAADLVLCVGMIYHLENPFLAIRNLAGLTRVCIYVESMVIDEPRPTALLCEEGRTASQGRNYIAFIPSESCLVKMLYRSGFTDVYRPGVPDDSLYRSSPLFVKRRAVVVAAREPLPVPSLVRISETRSPKPSWERFPRLWRGVRALRGLGGGLVSHLTARMGVWSGG